ncbi:MAG: hypothetical protein PHR35_09835 [Kiritimatiellae bacterium]|nr:hypothetical protein [Kiritimatiellia bacterium]
MTALLAAAALTAVMFHARHDWFDGGRFIERDHLLFLALWLPLLWLVRQRRCTGRAEPARLDTAIIVLLSGLLLTVCSNTPQHPWFFFFGWFRAAGNTSLLASGFERLVLLVTVITPLLLTRRRLAGSLLTLLLILQCACFVALWRYTGGMALYRDDHPSFMFRLHEFTQTFPAMTVFNPWWNAGVVNSVGASSGIGAVALPLFPLWRSLPVHTIYTPLLGVLFILVMPCLMAMALRVMRASWTAAASAGLLALAFSRYFFVWTLHFGTVGSSFAMSFLPPFAALTYVILVQRRAGWRLLAAWMVSLFFLLQWPPGAIMAGALSAGALWNARRWRWRPLLRLALAAFGVALLLLPNLLAIGTSDKLMSFVMHAPAAKPAEAAEAFDRAKWCGMFLQTWGKRLIEAHPLVVFLGVGGVLVWPLRRLRRWLLPAIYLLMLTAAWGPLLLPHLQLERMALPSLLLAVIPAALWCGRLLRSGDTRMAVARAMLLVLLLLGGLTARRLYKGQGYARFNAMPAEIASFADWVREEVPPEGRLIFLGKNVHGFGHGHIAYLPLLTQREMMACDYYAFPPRMVEYDYPPRPWRESAAGLAEFMRLHGVTHATSYLPDRLRELRDAPDLFAELPDRHETGFALFALRNPVVGRMFAGRGRVTAESGQLRLETDGAAEVVLRYNWNARLKASGGATLFPHAITNGVVFIGVRTAGAEPVTVR